MKLTPAQEGALRNLLLPDKETAYDCHVPIGTMYALEKLGLIESFQRKGDIVWGGWERSTKTFRLTEQGRDTAINLMEGKVE
jgi:hypothetical protein